MRSKQLTDRYNNALKKRRELKEQYPDKNFIVVHPATIPSREKTASLSMKKLKNSETDVLCVDIFLDFPNI